MAASTAAPVLLQFEELETKNTGVDPRVDKWVRERVYNRLPNMTWLCAHHTAQEFIEIVKAPFHPEHRIFQREALHDRSSLMNHYIPSFYDGSLTEAVAMFESGWPEGARKVERLSADVTSTVFRQAEKVARFDVAPGEWVDTDRFLAGEPEVFGELVDGDSPVRSLRGKYVHLMVNGSMCCDSCSCVNCDFKWQDGRREAFVNRGVAICAAIDILESLGVRCKVSMVYSQQNIVNRAAVQGMECGRKPRAMLFTVMVKDYADRLDMDLLAFSVAHPAMLRRLSFAYMEHASRDLRVEFRIQGRHVIESYSDGQREPWGISHQRGAYGSLFEDLPKEVLAGDERESVLYFPALRQQERAKYETPAGARDVLMGVLRKQGVFVDVHA